MSQLKKGSTKPLSGMRDFLPEELGRRRYVVEVVRRIYEAHGFAPLETPTIEHLGALLGKYGEEGDQLLYRILHRRDALKRALALPEVREADLAEQGLRYDLTVPLARVVANYELPKFFKRYQIQPVWRADRPGRGRFREFYQCDVDVTGTSSPIAEAEVCSAVADVLSALGFVDFEIRLNHRELLRALIRSAGIDAGLEGKGLVAIDKLDKIGQEGVRVELVERGISAASAERLMTLVSTTELPRLREQLSGDPRGVAALDELAGLFEILQRTPAKGRVRFSPELARGLGYYTGAIFEIAVPDLAGSLGGGGRYDDLVGMFGKKQVPAVGFSLGLERILVVMEERGMFPPLELGPELLLCWLDVEIGAVLEVAAALRSQGLRVEVYPEAAKLGKQIGYADTPGVKAPVAAIFGRGEAEEGAITLKHLASGQQARVAIGAAKATIAAWRAGPEERLS